MAGRISELLHQHFEEHQLNECALGYSAASRAAAIKNATSSIAIDRAISNLSLEESFPSQCSDDTTRLVLLQYVDNLMAANLISANREGVERMMELISACAAIFQKEVGEAIVARTIQYSAVLLERVRGQASVLIGYLLMYISKNCDEGWRSMLVALSAALLPRLKDKSQPVRNSAIHSCTLFIHQHNGENEFVDLRNGILWNLWHDPSMANRMHAIEAVPVVGGTVDHIVTRIRDVKAKVRVQALAALRKVDPLSQMTSNHFAEVVRNGLSDRCSSTKKATSILICSKWMKAAKFDPVKLLKHMDVITNEGECEAAMKVILTAARSGDSTLLENLSDPEIRAFQASTSLQKRVEESIESYASWDPEHLFFTRIAYVTAQQSTMLSFEEKSDCLNNVVPDIPMLCEQFSQYSSRLSDSIQDGDLTREDECCFGCIQLLHLSELAGLWEEGSRRHFSSFLRNFLSSESIPDDLIEPCIQALRSANEVEGDFLDAIDGIITCLLPKSGVIEDGPGDPCNVLRILSILTVVLENASTDALSHSLFRHAQSVIFPALTHPSTVVREAGVSCLGTLGCFTPKLTVTVDFKPIMLEVASNDKEKLEIRSKALLVFSDWTLLFPEMLHPYKIDDTKTCFFAIVEEMLHHTNLSVVAIAAEISIKLLFSRRVCESSLVGRLLVLFFSPHPQIGTHVDLGDAKEVGNMARLQQLLSIFFCAYCVKSECGRNATLDSVEFALSCAVKEAVQRSSKKKINFPFLKMIQFVCDTVECGSEVDGVKLDARAAGISVALSISVQLSRFLSSAVEVLPVSQSRALCKYLGNLKISREGEDKATLCELRDLLEELGMLVSDDVSLCYLSTFRQTIGEIDLSDVRNIHESFDGDSTTADSLMKSMDMMTVSDKENTRDSSYLKSKVNTKGERKPDRSPDVLENNGSSTNANCSVY